MLVLKHFYMLSKLSFIFIGINVTFFSHTIFNWY